MPPFENTSKHSDLKRINKKYNFTHMTNKLICNQHLKTSLYLLPTWPVHLSVSASFAKAQEYIIPSLPSITSL